jgi:hypothetical protein
LTKINDLKIEIPYHEKISNDKTYLIQYYHSTLSNNFTSEELLIFHNKTLESETNNDKLFAPLRTLLKSFEINSFKKDENKIKFMDKSIDYQFTHIFLNENYIEYKNDKKNENNDEYKTNNENNKANNENNNTIDNEDSDNNLKKEDKEKLIDEFLNNNSLNSNETQYIMDLN